MTCDQNLNSPLGFKELYKKRILLLITPVFFQQYLSFEKKNKKKQTISVFTCTYSCFSEIQVKRMKTKPSRLMVNDILSSTLCAMSCSFEKKVHVHSSSHMPLVGFFFKGELHGKCRGGGNEWLLRDKIIFEYNKKMCVDVMIVTSWRKIPMGEQD